MMEAEAAITSEILLNIF